MAALESLSGEQIAMLEELSAAYGAISRCQSDALAWPPEALGLTEPVDMLGKARRIVGGPGYSLPPGTWLFHFVVSITGNLSKNNLAANLVVGATRFPETKTGIIGDGEFGFTLRCTVERPNQPIGVIVRTMEGAIEGRLELGPIRIRRDTPAV